MPRPRGPNDPHAVTKRTLPLLKVTFKFNLVQRLDRALRAFEELTSSTTLMRHRASNVAAQTALALALMSGGLSCERRDVDVELPTAGRALSRTERDDLQRIADTTFRDARKQLDGLPARLTLIVRWGKDVIPETGENGAAGYPGNIAWTMDPDRDVLATIQRQLRPMLTSFEKRGEMNTPVRAA